MSRLFELISKYIFPSNPTTGTIGSIDFNVVIIQCCGIPLLGVRQESRKVKTFWSVYGTVILALATVGYASCEIYDIVLCWGNLNYITQNTSVSFSHIAAAIKVLNILYHRKEILRIVEQLRFMNRKYVISEEQKKTFFRGEFENKILLVVYSALVWYTATFAMILAALNPTTLAGKVFPYRVTIPDFIPSRYHLPYMTLAVLVYGLQIVCLDCLHVNLINQTRYQMKTLNMAFDRMTVETTDFDPDKYLHSLVEHHNLIFRVREQIENFLKLPLLTQFLSSLMIIALTGFQTTVQSDMRIIIVIYFYWGVIFCQLFVYCWLGNAVSEQNNTLAFCGYNSSWYDFGQKFRKSLLIFLVNAQRPFYFSAGGFVELSLVTYTGILSKSYTYLAVLRQLYGEK